MCPGCSLKVLGVCTAASVVWSFTTATTTCRAAQVKASELVEGLQLVHAGFFTEASFRAASGCIYLQHYNLGSTATFKSWHEGGYAALPCKHSGCK